MGSLKGKVTWDSATNFHATFKFDNGVTTSYSGSINKSMEKFEVTQATATYKNIDKDFAGTKNWKGVIGQNSIDITIGDVVHVTGDLNDAIDAANTVNGRGSWTSSSTEE
ncbi:MAG: hypothetical protein M1824_002825 [Vezdaea acicularis]|nr:MAG: hypothetical protein M1824_002825 [Vezdaea acicularis]